MPAGLPHGSTVPAPDGQTNTLWLPHVPPPFPGGDEALTSIRLAFYAARAAGSEMTGPTPSQLKKKKVSAKRKDFQIRVAISVINEPAFSIALTSLLVHQIPIKGLFPQRDAVADKTVLPSRKLRSRGL